MYIEREREREREREKERERKRIEGSRSRGKAKTAGGGGLVKKSPDGPGGGFFLWRGRLQDREHAIFHEEQRVQQVVARRSLGAFEGAQEPRRGVSRRRVHRQRLHGSAQQARVGSGWRVHLVGAASRGKFGDRLFCDSREAGEHLFGAPEEIAHVVSSVPGELTAVVAVENKRVEHIQKQGDTGR